MKMLKCGDHSVWYQPEPTIAEILSDSLVKVVMRADGVDPKELESLFHDVARRRGQSPRFAGHRRSGHAS